MKRMMLVLLSGICLSATAQEKKKERKSSMIMTKSIGVSFQRFGDLNQRIAPYSQYKPLKDYMWTLGLGSIHTMNNFVSGFSVTGGSSLSGDRDKKSSAMRFLSAGLDLGYDVIPSDKVMLYPTVGVGVETYRATFYKDVSAVDFDDVLTSPTVQNSIRSVKFNNTFATYRFGLGFALKSPKGDGTIGLQLGYTGSFKDNRWKSSDNQTLADAPLDNLSRFNVGIVFGGGGMMMRK